MAVNPKWFDPRVRISDPRVDAHILPASFSSSLPPGPLSTRRPAMSFNATIVEPMTAYIGHAQGYFSSLTTAQRVLFVLVNIPILSVVFNVLSQLVR